MDETFCEKVISKNAEETFAQKFASKNTYLPVVFEDLTLNYLEYIKIKLNELLNSKDYTYTDIILIPMDNNFQNISISEKLKTSLEEKLKLPPFGFKKVNIGNLQIQFFL